MENNKSLLMSILCGVGVCFLFMGIVFLLPKENKNYSNNLDEIDKIDKPSDEINLADGYVNFYKLKVVIL